MPRALVSEPVVTSFRIKSPRGRAFLHRNGRSLLALSFWVTVAGLAPPLPVSRHSGQAHGDRRQPGSATSFRLTVLNEQCLEEVVLPHARGNIRSMPAELASAVVDVLLASSPQVQDAASVLIGEVHCPHPYAFGVAGEIAAAVAAAVVVACSRAASPVLAFALSFVLAFALPFPLPFASVPAGVSSLWTTPVALGCGLGIRQRR